MNSQANVAIQNLQGLFTHAWNKRSFHVCARLFAEKEAASFEAPDDGVCLSGVEMIANGLAQAAKQMGMPFLLSHTPVIRIESDCEAKASWYLSTVQMGADHVVQGSARIDARLVKECDGWRYKRLQLYYMMTLEPQEVEPGQLEFESEKIRLLEEEISCCAADFVMLQKLIGRWCHDRRQGAEGWFSERNADCISLLYPPFLSSPLVGKEQILNGLECLKTQEAEMTPIPMTIPMLTTPLISVTGTQAVCSWVVISHDALDMKQERPLIAHRVGQLCVECVKEDGEWKILSLELRPLFELPHSEVLLEDSNDTLLHVEGAWLNAPVSTNCNQAADIQDILTLEEYIAFWVSGLRYRSEAPFYYNRLAIDHPEMLTYRLGIRPVKQGLDEVTREIFAMVSKFSTLQPKSPGNHIGTTPLIEISPDGTRATAVWFDYGWTTVAEVFGITRPPYLANPAIARYEHRYMKTDNGWKLYGFHWAPFYRVGKLTFNYETTKGWSGTTSTKRFPLPLDEYIYEDDLTLKGRPIRLDPPIIDCPYERPWTGGTDSMGDR